MSAAPSWVRSTIVFVALAVAVALGSVAAPPREADAALICQHQRKPLVRLRTNACKKNEQPVFDSGTQATQDQQIGALQAEVGEHTTLLATTCPGDPARRLLTGELTVSGGLIMLGYTGGSLCRTLDDDQAGCAQAYERGAYGPSACAYVAGKCLVCDLMLDANGVCRNTCQSHVTCPADPARTTFVNGCSEVADAASCSHAWALSIDFATATEVIRAASCYWDPLLIPPACVRCDPEAISRGKCANSCLAAADLPRCRLGGRTFGRCDVLDGNPAACGLTFEVGYYGSQTCWYDAGPGQCEGCQPLDEAQGKCSNGC